MSINVLSPSRLTVDNNPNIKWKHATTGRAHSLAVDSTGSIWAWGENDNGRLGLGAVSTNVTSPRKITSPDLKWKSVFSYNNFSMALAYNPQ